GGSGGGVADAPSDTSVVDRDERAAIDEPGFVDERAAVDDRPALDDRPAITDAGVDVSSCATCVLRVQYRVGDTNATDNQMKPQLNVVNRGSVAVPLVELTLRYWL